MPLTASCDFFVLRAPLLSLDELLRWAESGPRISAADLGFDQRYSEIRRALTKYLQELLARAELKEALFLAAPQLEGPVALWLREPDTDEGRDTELRIAEQLAAFAATMELGGFQIAPVVGSVADWTTLTLGERSNDRRKTQIDIEFLTAHAEKLAWHPAVRSRLLHRNNSSLYFTHEKLRCGAPDANESKRTYRFFTSERTPYLECAVQSAERGALPGALVSSLIASDPEIPPEDASAYVGQLIDEAVLVPELGPALTSADPLAQLAGQLAALPEAKVEAQAVQAARESLVRLDAAGLGVHPSRYREISEHLSPTAPAHARMFRVQLFKSAPNVSLSQRVIDEALRGAELLARLIRPNDRIRRFTESFFARYGDEVIPLVEALDEDYGIGFEGSAGTSEEPLLESIRLSVHSEPAGTWGPREALLLRKLEQVWREGSQRIALNDKEIELMAAVDALPLPDSFAVLAALGARSNAELDEGAFSIRIDGVSGPSGVNLLAPFCQPDSRLKELVQRHLRAEELLQPEGIFAEIIHFPHVGDPNVVVRPRFREHEIAYLGRPSAEHTIPLTDLRLSIVDERLRLTSEQLGAELLPRLTAPHDFVHPQNPVIYRFLCALQNQGTASALQWSWGPFEDIAFLPRVTSGRLVFSRARWKIGSEAAKSLAKASAIDRFQALQKLRESLGLPRFVEMAHERRRWIFDLENVLSAECLSARLQAEPRPVFQEMFPSPEELVVGGPEGRFVHQLIVPFVRKQSVALPRGRSPRLGAPRSFAPGSEWLQVNLYCGTTLADEVLRTVIAPAVRRALASGDADAWYFIRYTDPQFHVRIRLHGPPERLVPGALRELRSSAAPLLHDRRIWAIRLDTYHREIGRYGGSDGVVVAERIFRADSDAVVSVLEALLESEAIDDRWQLALRGMDMLLSDLRLEAIQKMEVARRAREDVARRLKIHPSTDLQLARKFETESASLRRVLTQSIDDGSAFAHGLAALRRRSERLRPLTGELQTLDRAALLSRTVAEQAYSFIHMFANRVFASTGLSQELVLYDFLHRIYTEDA